RSIKENADAAMIPVAPQHAKTGPAGGPGADSEMAWEGSSVRSLPGPRMFPFLLVLHALYRNHAIRKPAVSWAFSPAWIASSSRSGWLWYFSGHREVLPGRPSYFGLQIALQMRPSRS